MGLIQTISLILDERAKTQLATDMAAAGAKGIAALRQEFNRKMGDLKADLSQGLIDEPTFRAQARRVADAFNQEIIKRMDLLKAAGKDTSKEYGELGRQIKLASDTGIQRGGLLNNVWGKMKSTVGALGAALGVAFSVRAIVDFAKSSIAAAEQSDRAWMNLAASLRVVGVDFVKVKNTVVAALTVISKRTVFDTDDLAKSFSSLVDMTGDYALSLRATGVAADLARAKQIPLEKAVGLVGKAINGQSRGLKVYVGDVRTGAAALDDISAALGDVTARMTPFERLIGTAAIAWDNFKEGVGRTIVGIGTASGLFEVLTVILEELQGWVEKNKDGLITMAREGLAVVVPLIRDFFGEIFAGVRTLNDWWNQLVKTNAAVEDTNLRLSDAQNVLKNTGTEIKQLSAAFGLVGEAINRVAFNLGKSFAQLAVSVLGVIVKMDEGLSKFLSHIPGMGGVSKALAAEAERAKKQIAGLTDFIVKQDAAIQASHTRTNTLQLDLQTQATVATEDATEDMTASYEEHADKAGDAVEVPPTRGKKAVKELSDATKKHMAEMTEAYESAGTAFTDKHVGAILQGKDAVIKAHKDMEAQQRKSTEELQQAQTNIQSAYIKTGDAATEQGRLIEQATRDAIAGKKAEAEEIERTRAASQNYAEEYWKRDVPLFLQGQQQQQEALHKTRDAGKESAEETKGSWLDALGVMNDAFKNLSGMVGGALDGIVNGMGHVVSAASAIASGIAGIGTKIGGLTGLLTKLAGGASIIGGIITAAGIAIDLIKGLGKALGLGDSEWEKTNQESMRLYHIATQPRPGARTAALAALLERATNLPDPGNRANARILYEDALLVLAGKKKPIGFEGPSGDPRGQPAPPSAPPPRTGFGPQPPPTSAPPPPPRTGGGPQNFQQGGWVRQTGWATVDQGELVLPSMLARQLAMVVGRPSASAAPAPSQISTDNRSLSVVVNLTGIADRDIPQRVVDAISQAQGREFQKRALLQGNARIE